MDTTKLEACVAAALREDWSAQEPWSSEEIDWWMNSTSADPETKALATELSNKIKAKIEETRRRGAAEKNAS